MMNSRSIYLPADFCLDNRFQALGWNLPKEGARVDVEVDLRHKRLIITQGKRDDGAKAKEN